MKTVVSAGSIITKVLEVSNRDNDSAMEARLFRELRTLYFRLCSLHPFDALRRTKEYGSSDTPLIPSNACDVRFVVDENDGVYIRRDSGPSASGKKTYVLNTISDLPGTSGLPFTSDDCVINSGENTFASVLLGQMIFESRIPDGIAVSGADPHNATYSFDSIVGDRPKFTVVSGVTTYAIAYDPDRSLWVYSETSTGYVEKYAVYSESSSPPVAGWVSMSTGAPASFSIAYTEATGETAVGEYVKIGDDDELFEITAESGSTFTIDRTYRGDSLTAGTIYVRLPITQTISLYDENNELVDDVDYTVYYWIIPPALRRTSDLILLPSSLALELLLLRSTPEAKATRPVSQAEIDRSISELIKQNPDRPPMQPRRNRVDLIGDMDTSRFYGGTR